MKTFIYRGIRLTVVCTFFMLLSSSLRAQESAAIRVATFDISSRVFATSFLVVPGVPSLDILKEKTRDTERVEHLDWLCSKQVSTYYLSSATNQHNALMTHPVKMVTNIKYLSMVESVRVDDFSIRFVEIQVNSEEQIPSALNLASLSRFPNLEYIHLRLNFRPCDASWEDQQESCEQKAVDSIFISNRPIGVQLFYTCKEVQ